ncbi:hypothetical protein L7F22_063180 [Adiantum nelumboides]|nr:hypothetical protein [Adiantum nelumboides]
MVFFDPGARANFISPELASKLGIRAEEMGMTGEAGLACPGHSEAVTPILGKLRLHIQSYVDAEEFHIMPLQDCDVLLGIPWCYRLHAVVDTFHKKITLVYAMMSFLSLTWREKSIYFGSIRDVYEAWVIYNFLSLCLAWVGGPGAVVTNLNGGLLRPSWCLMTCCLPSIPLDGRFIRRCKQGCLQFVFLKIVLVAVTFVLYAKNRYEDGNFNVEQGYLYVTIIYTISYSLALYALVLFYVACKDLLCPFKPVPKFIIIKSVVFLTYWQGVLVFLAAKMGFIKNTDDAADVQNFVICVEMAMAAVGHIYAFPYDEYMEAKKGCSGGLADSFTHAFNVKDVFYDTVHQFAPTYHDYVLYSGGSAEVPPDNRVQTLESTGHEMDILHKHKQMVAMGKPSDSSSPSLPSAIPEISLV